MQKVSIIMPVYNRADIVRDSIDSILMQNYPEFELIIIDDNSDDGLDKVILDIQSDRIKYYKLSRNSGQSYSRNLGAHLASGEIIAFQDSDDLWTNDRLSKQVEMMQGYDFSFCAFLFNHERYPFFEVKEEKLYEQILHRPIIGTPTLFCKKEVFLNVGGFNENYRCFEDYDLSLRLSRDYKGLFIDKAMLIVKKLDKHVGGDENANEGLRVRCDLYKRYYVDINRLGLRKDWIDGIFRFERLCDKAVYEYELARIRKFELDRKNSVMLDGASNINTIEQLFYDTLNVGVEFKVGKGTLGDSKRKSEVIPFDKNGKSIDELLVFFKNVVLPASTNFSNVKFMGFPDAGNSVGGLIGSIISDFMQQNLINETYCAPIATQMEIELINSLRQMVGYKKRDVISRIEDVGGIITYGGTGSNCTAMLLAREKKCRNTLIQGISDTAGFFVVVPKGIGHYSIRSSLKWLGCGDKIIEVETDNYRYCQTKLERVLKENKEHIMAVVVYAGDSRTMTIEHLDEIIDLVHRIVPEAWCHVDACHGFSLLYSENLKYKMNGVSEYDSISFDPHKVMAIPYCCSALLLKDPDSINLISSNSELIMNEDYAFGKITPFIGSKSWVSLKLWFFIQNMGLNKIGRMIDYRYQMAQKFKEKLLKTNKYILLNCVDYNSVVFVWTGGNNLSMDEINYINKKIYEKMLEEKEYYFHQFQLKVDMKGILYGKRCMTLRYMSGNDNIIESDLDNAIIYIDRLGERIYREYLC